MYRAVKDANTSMPHQSQNGTEVTCGVGGSNSWV